jgi:hypothetical protein
LYQVEHGLFAAQEKFFSAWLVWVFGVIPFPGAKLVLGLLMLNLLGYMANVLAFQALRPGILLIHAGLLVMLIGGAITHYYAEESFLSLWEGETFERVQRISRVGTRGVETRRGDPRCARDRHAWHSSAGETLAFEPTPITVDGRAVLRSCAGVSDQGGCDAVTCPL